MNAYLHKIQSANLELRDEVLFLDLARRERGLSRSAEHKLDTLSKILELSDAHLEIVAVLCTRTIR